MSDNINNNVKFSENRRKEGFEYELDRMDQTLSNMALKIKTNYEDTQTPTFYKIAKELTVFIENMLPDLRDKADTYLFFEQEELSIKLHHKINMIEESLQIIIDYLNKNQQKK